MASPLAIVQAPVFQFCWRCPELLSSAAECRARAPGPSWPPLKISPPLRTLAKTLLLYSRSVGRATSGFSSRSFCEHTESSAPAEGFRWGRKVETAWQTLLRPAPVV